jgi:hypothetical protein
MLSSENDFISPSRSTMTPSDHAFPVLDVSDDDPLELRPKRKKGLTIGQSRLIKLGFLAFHVMALAIFLNYVGIARVPGLERLTRARLMSVRTEVQPKPAAKKPARPVLNSRESLR